MLVVAAKRNAVWALQRRCAKADSLHGLLQIHVHCTLASHVPAALYLGNLDGPWLYGS